MRNSERTGAQGEQAAQQFLRRRGYTILATNWSSIYGELDIVAEYKGTLVFIEVKTRRSSNTESALAGITAVKRERILKAVYQYLDENVLDRELPWRIDVVAVALGRKGPAKIAHVEDAFDW